MARLARLRAFAQDVRRPDPVERRLGGALQVPHGLGVGGFVLASEMPKQSRQMMMAEFKAKKDK